MDSKSFQMNFAAVGLLSAAVIVGSAAAQQAPAPPTAQPAPASPTAPQDRVAALKTSLQTGLAGQKNYEWTETVAVSMKGEEKSCKQNHCAYGADGKVQKTPIEGQAEAGGKKPGGIRGKVVAKKTGEVEEAMKGAVALITQYVPPDPARIQKAKDAGKLAITPPDASGRVQVRINDYLKPGDLVTMDLDGAKNSLLGLAVASYMESAKDAVNMKVTMGTLEDGTLYAQNTHLEVKSQELGVAIENGGYKKKSP
jgi:hypothetical protein